VEALPTLEEPHESLDRSEALPDRTVTEVYVRPTGVIATVLPDCMASEEPVQQIVVAELTAAPKEVSSNPFLSDDVDVSNLNETTSGKPGETTLDEPNVGRCAKLDRTDPCLPLNDYDRKCE